MGTELVWCDASESLRAVVERARAADTANIVLRDHIAWYAFTPDELSELAADERPAKLALALDLAFASNVRGPGSLLGGPAPVISWRQSSGLEGSFALGADVVTIGRDAACTFSMDDAMISRCHARIFSTERGYIAEDQGSAGGIYVNNQRARSSVLIHGDVLQLGSTLMRFSDPSVTLGALRSRSI